MWALRTEPWLVLLTAEFSLQPRLFLCIGKVTEDQGDGLGGQNKTNTAAKRAVVVHTCDPSTPRARWQAETGEPHGRSGAQGRQRQESRAEAPGPAAWTAAQQKKGGS